MVRRGISFVSVVCVRESGFVFVCVCVGSYSFCIYLDHVDLPAFGVYSSTVSHYGRKKRCQGIDKDEGIIYTYSHTYTPIYVNV